MDGLRIVARNGTGDLVLSVEGEIDLATSPELADALHKALESAGRRLVVDLRAVRFLDSSGLSLLVQQDRLARAAGRQLIIVKPPPAVQQVFELTALDQHLTMVDEPPG